MRKLLFLVCVLIVCLGFVSRSSVDAGTLDPNKHYLILDSAIEVVCGRVVQFNRNVLGEKLRSGSRFKNSKDNVLFMSLLLFSIGGSIEIGGLVYPRAIGEECEFYGRVTNSGLPYRDRFELMVSTMQTICDRTYKLRRDYFAKYNSFSENSEDADFRSNVVLFISDIVNECEFVDRVANL